MSRLLRAVGSISRRSGRPELLAAVDPAARQAQRDSIAIGAVLACALGSDLTYVDVGTNRGQVLRDAVRVAPQGRHVAFEPIPALAAEVAKSFPEVDCRQMALGSRAEVTEFCYFQELDGWSGLRRRPEISDEQGRPEYITVQVSTLDAELADVMPHVLKIDVEGGELAVLEGGRSLLTRARPVVIFEHDAPGAALYGTAPGALWDLLTDLGYRVFTCTGAGPFTRTAFVQARGIVNWMAVAKAVTTVLGPTDASVGQPQTSGNGV
jgi:FkbM family methyltransferase